jgi:hypothetical protein
MSCCFTLKYGRPDWMAEVSVPVLGWIAFAMAQIVDSSLN